MNLVKIKAEFPKKLEFLFQPSRYKVGYGGRGAGRSWGFSRALLILGARKPLRILCAREFQSSIRDSVHRVLSDQIELLGLGDFYDVQRTTIISKNGTEFTFEGMRMNVNNIRSKEGSDIVWVEEAHTTSKHSWSVLIPTIRKPGSEIWMTFNPEFEDDYTYDRFVLHPPPDAVVVEMNWRDNPWFPEVLEAERLDLKERDPDEYDHVWEGHCRRWLEGAIYANELRAAYDGGRIREVPFDPALPVSVVADIGRTDDTALWFFQMTMGEVHLIDTFGAAGTSPGAIASQITGQQIDIDIIADGSDARLIVRRGDDIPEIAHRKEYEIDTVWLPHDARAKTQAASGKSIEQQMREVFGWGTVRIVPELSREDGIGAARTIFRQCWFDAERCADGLKALRRYRRELQRDEVSFQRAPKHDWASHFADAFRYLAVACRGAPAERKPLEPERDAWGARIEAENWKVA